MADFLALRFSIPFLPIAGPFLLFVCDLKAPESISMAGDPDVSDVRSKVAVMKRSTHCRQQLLWSPSQHQELRVR